MREIVLYSNDIRLIVHWQKSLAQPCLVVDSIEELMKISNSIVIMNYNACKRECKAILEQLTQNGNRVLVLHRTPDFDAAKQLLGWGVKGYGNALMRDHFLIAAVETLQDNMVWLYPEFTTQLITQMDTGAQNDLEVHLKKLSEREREVALLLHKGDIYNVIADKLQITPRTVKAHAQNIYAKLNVKDRLGLALLLK
ncbi:LuxR C-terminal-related transcriptional regulator [bacterium]|jgi:DNA-binding NarL/FixJ family response regulator|nr:LuxR C-terminal-related transcriptional regulator [bacterium]